MNVLKRWTAAALALALAASLSISAALAAPSESFADFRIDAFQIDAVDRNVAVEAYGEEYTCKINQVTRDATFYIQPQADGVRVTLDYLTDLDGSGVRELRALPGGGDSPVWDSLDAQGNLVQGGNEVLTAGQTYILPAEALASRFQQTEEARARAEGRDSYTKTFPLCRVTISRADPASGQTYEQLYYVEIFGDIILPRDVLRDNPCCDAIEYCLVHGLLSGMGDGSFNPEGFLNRAQLAQVLWTMGGCQWAEAADFTDVAADDWFCQAVSWCRQESLIAGYADGSFLPDAPLTREQLATFLFRYAGHTGSTPYSGSDLSRYDDAASVSSWAYDSMRWAVSNRLLIISDGALRPGGTVTRAELAQALYAYQSTLTSLGMW